jgi:hypothetical protein
LITFLASPKPFSGIANEQQCRSIRNWQGVCAGAQVILYGASAGIEKAGHDLGAEVVTEIESSPAGVPLFGAIADHAARHGRYDLQVYLNCDILLSGILQAFESIEFTKFLLIGERLDLPEGLFVDLNSPGWKNKVLDLANEGQIKLHGPTGIDYFAFRRGLWAGLPPVIIGRGGYDNALLAHCMRRRVPIIDGTARVLALHQFHGYGHVLGGAQYIANGPEAEVNFQAAGGKRSATLVSDADYVLENGRVSPNVYGRDRLRYFELKCRYAYGFPKAGLAVRLVWRMLSAARLIRRREIDVLTLVANTNSEH